MNAGPKKRHPEIALAAVITFLVLSAIGIRYLGPDRNRSKNLDFWPYYFAAQAVHDNPRGDLYHGATERNPQLAEASPNSELMRHALRAGFGGVQQYVYPPLLADVLAPLGLMSPNRAAAIWGAINLAVVFGALLSLGRLLRLRLLSFEFATLVLCAFSFFPIDESLHFGQVAIVMFALWAVGVQAYSEGRTFLSAAALALATVLKITPVLLVPVMLIWRERRWLIWYVSLLTGFVALMAFYNGWHTLTDFAAVAGMMGAGAPTFRNKSIASLIAWVYYGRVFDSKSVWDVMSTSVPILTAVTRTVSLAVFGTSLVLLLRHRARVNQSYKTTAMAIFLLITLCVPPISWRHGYSAAFIPLAMCWADALRGQASPRRVALLALTSVSIGTVFLDAGSEVIAFQPLKILMCAMPVLLTVLFSLDALARPDAKNPPPVPQSIKEPSKEPDLAIS